jgi:hypothetical protein
MDVYSNTVSSKLFLVLSLQLAQIPENMGGLTELQVRKKATTAMRIWRQLRRTSLSPTLSLSALLGLANFF